MRQGLVALSAEAPNEATLALYGPGEVFGELCFCGERQRFTARAVQPSTIQEAPATQILHLMRTEPSFAGALLETLSNRLRSAQAELHGFVANIVVHAVGTKLLNLSVPATSDDTEWLDLPAAFTHDQLARVVKVRGETLTRVLRRLEALGLIDYSRADRIQIHGKRMRGFLAGPE